MLVTPDAHPNGATLGTVEVPGPWHSQASFIGRLAASPVSVSRFSFLVSGGAMRPKCLS
jgi:hypothetical protein